MESRRVYRFGDFLLRPAARDLQHAGADVSLPSRAFDCLVYLVEHRDRAVGRDELAAAIWGRADISDAQLSQTVRHARRAIGDDGNDQALVRTIQKFGYRWVADTRACEEVARAGAVSVHARAEPPERADIAQAPTAVATAANPTKRRLVPWLAAALAVCVIAGIWITRSTPPASQPTNKTVFVLPVDVGQAGGQDWIRLGAMDLVAKRMREAGAPVPTSESTLALLGAEHPSDAAQLRDRMDAEWVIDSDAQRTADGWRVRMRAQGAHGRSFTAENHAADPLDAFRASADSLLEQLGYAPPTPPPGGNSLAEIEQRAQAALLENDIDGARRILLEAADGARNEPELRYQLALVDYRAGNFAEVERSLRSLLADESTSGNPLLQARAHYRLGAVDMMSDAAAAAESEFDQALSLLDSRRDALDYGQALSGRSSARITLGHYDEGLRDLGQARIRLEQAGDALALARLDLTFGGVELLRGRPGQAVPALQKALAELERLGAVNERLHGYSLLVESQMLLLDYTAATASNEAAIALLPRISEKLHRAETLIDHVNLLLTRGDWKAAVDALAELDALDMPANTRASGLRDAAHAELAWQRADAQTAFARADAAVTALPANESARSAAMLLLRQRAAQRLGKPAPALPDADRNGPMATAPPAASSLAIARAEAKLHEHDATAAEALYRQALAQAESSAIPQALLIVADSYVSFLLSAGRNEEAGGLAGRLAPIAVQDFSFALLETRLHQAEGEVQAWTVALNRAEGLAGQRPIPSQLRTPPLPSRKLQVTMP
ncbi:MAG: winged helix-turn-helix domain-containing protein [Dokdonella sp.]